MIIGTVPQNIQEPIKKPTLQRMRMAGIASEIFSMIPVCKSFHVEPCHHAITPAMKAEMIIMGAGSNLCIPHPIPSRSTMLMMGIDDINKFGARTSFFVIPQTLVGRLAI